MFGPCAVTLGPCAAAPHPCAAVFRPAQQPLDGPVGQRENCRVVSDPLPVDPSELEFLAVGTRAPYTRDYAGAQGGKPAHYMLRWVNSKGETGPWSETATATIGA